MRTEEVGKEEEEFKVVSETLQHTCTKSICKYSYEVKTVLIFDHF